MTISINPYSKTDGLTIANDIAQVSGWVLNAGWWGSNVTIEGDTDTDTVVELLNESGVEYHILT
jgi:hypothetical protein